MHLYGWNPYEGGSLMASRHPSSALPGIEPGRVAEDALLGASLWNRDPTAEIPKWLMVLAARGEVTLRVLVDLEDDPIGDLDDTASGD
ncbi:MAG: hypothetical protein ACRD3M_01235 [Thermoanaerobaculia bacterium]